MSLSTVKRGKKNSSKKSVIVSKKVKSHEKDPFFVKKAKAAEAFLNKHGLPQILTK